MRLRWESLCKKGAQPISVLPRLKCERLLEDKRAAFFTKVEMGKLAAGQESSVSYAVGMGKLATGQESHASHSC